MRSEEKVVSVIDPVTNNCSSEGYNFPPIVITDKSNLILKDNSVLREVRDKFECSPKMTGILKEFTDLYKEKLHRLNEAEGEEELKRKVSVLESWVSDLGEQNAILVGTVEDLEREAARRVELLQEKLDHMAVATRDSCVALTDHQGQMRCLVEEKHTLEAEMQHLREQHLVLKGDRSAFEDENDKLKDDLNSLIQVISRVRLTGRWDYSDLSFNSIRPQEIFGTELQSPAGPCHESGDVFSSEICVQNDAEKIFRNSVTSLMSLEEEDLCIPKLRREIKTLKKNLSETNSVITSRDEHIAHLQCEVTSVHHDLSMSRSQMDRTTSTLDSLVDRGRHHSLEISRRDDVIRHLLSPTPQHFSEGGCDAEERDARGKNTDVVKKNGNTDVEGELSRNIDVLALRLQTSEAECEALRGQHAALTATHDRCHAPGHSRRVREDLEQCQKCLSEVKTELEESREEIEELRAELEEKEKVLESERRNWKRREKSSRSSLVSTQVQTDRVSDEFELPNLKLSKLENELSEKNILIRELQNHLVVSREELRLKDETLFNVEQKLLSSRRGCDEKEERTLYLTSQLTSLQLEVSRLHGTTQQLKMHLSNKSELVSKLESENRSLTQNHNEKSSLHEALSAQVRALTKEGHAKTKQISEQKLALSSVQETLVSATNEGHKLKAQIQSGSNMTRNTPSYLHPDRTTSLALTSDDSCKDLASHLSAIPPDLRPLNTDIPALNGHCPNVVSSLSRQNGGLVWAGYDKTRAQNGAVNPEGGLTNGDSPNGMPNGNIHNGMSNGNIQNGIMSDGMSNGNVPNGMFNGMSNGSISNGMPNGIMSNGISNDNTPKGMSNGNIPNGMIPNGIMPNGMSTVNIPNGTTTPRGYPPPPFPPLELPLSLPHLPQPPSFLNGNSHEPQSLNYYSSTYSLDPQLNPEPHNDPHNGSYNEPHNESYNKSHNEPHTKTYNEPQNESYNETHTKPHTDPQPQSSTTPTLPDFGIGFNNPISPQSTEYFHTKIGKKKIGATYGEVFEI